MFVTKRDGRLEEFNIEKLTSRIKRLCYNLNDLFLNSKVICEKILKGINNGITTSDLDNYSAEFIHTLTIIHYDHAILSSRISVSKLHKETKKKFSNVIKDLFESNNGIYNSKSIIDSKTYNIIQKNEDILNSAIVYDRDYDFNYIGFKTLEKTYLLKIKDKVVERPQHLFMRVSIGIHGRDIESAIETYKLMSNFWFIHATPTLYNAGTISPQLSSCFLIKMSENSIEEILKSISNCALISKYSGGIGLNITSIGASGCNFLNSSLTYGGIVPIIRVINETIRLLNYGTNKRPSAIAVYIEPWHADIIEFLQLKKNYGYEYTRGRDLFYGLWIPDLFMKRVESDDIWSLMCPNECKGLSECYGMQFDILYSEYENQNKFKKQIKARTLWYLIIESQAETGTPYMLYKDHCNNKSNQKNLGTITSSNLCAEIIEFTSKDEIAVCTLASIVLSKFYDEKLKNFDFNNLKEIAKIVTKNLNKIIDINFHPLNETKNSNEKHRPIGIGVQGFADILIKMKLSFEGTSARKLNIQIFESIYYGALEASCELAKYHGTYETYEGSPISKGILQFDLWEKIPTDLWNWSKLRENIARFGVRNSLLIAVMPTASTSLIIGVNESIEPYTSNIYTRRTLAGEFEIINHHLVKELCEINLWNDEIKDKIIAERGSIQNIEEIPTDLKRIFKTVWEISQNIIIEMAADRGPFVDQSQSLNIHIAEPNISKITSIHFKGWKLGLKTGMYYLRTKPASNAIAFTVKKEYKEEKNKNNKFTSLVKFYNDCTSCSS